LKVRVIVREVVGLHNFEEKFRDNKHFRQRLSMRISDIISERILVSVFYERHSCVKIKIRKHLFLQVE
jgi:hypothetical protein